MSAARDGSSHPTTPATPTYRVFAWNKWVPIAAILAALLAYFRIRGGNIKDAMIRPTVVLDARFGFTPATVRDTLSALGPQGRKLYVEMNRVDFILTPLVLREFLLNTFPPTSRRSGAIRDTFANAYALGDIMENIFVMMFLKGYPTVWDPFAWACCFGNVLKWSALYAAGFSIVYEFVVYIRGGVEARRQ